MQYIQVNLQGLFCKRSIINYIFIITSQILYKPCVSASEFERGENINSWKQIYVWVDGYQADIKLNLAWFMLITEPLEIYVKA